MTKTTLTYISNKQNLKYCSLATIIRRIASVRPFLSNISTVKLVASMITSRLDYCNATFAGVVDEQIARIQKIQNNAARLILGKKKRKKEKKKEKKRDHVIPLLKELHWLPVKYRIQYKLATLAFRHFDGTLPPYLSSSLWTITLGSFFDITTAQNYKDKLENLRWTFF